MGVTYAKMPKSEKAAKKKQAVVPYVRGYKPPSIKRCSEAIFDRSKVRTPVAPVYLQPDLDFFQPIPPPTSIDDWLAQYKEPGQSYSEFLRECPWLSSRKWKQTKQAFDPVGRSIREKYPVGKIYLLPLGEFSTGRGSAPSFSALMEYVRCFYGIPVQVLSGIELHTQGKEVYLTWAGSNGDKKEHQQADGRKRRRSPRSHRHELECRHDSTTGHTQLRVNSILVSLKQYVPCDAFFVMALTMLDLYEDKTDLFVAGMAAGNHRVGVFSFLRYDPTAEFSKEFWYDVRFRQDLMAEEERKRLVLQRSCKLLVHEIAHLLGVDHCIWFQCCMNGSGHLHEDFRQPMFLCPVDLHKLETLCGFDVLDRYRTMLNFFLRYKLVDEAKWVERRIQSIASKKI